MIISIIAIVKWLLFALSGGALYRGFSHGGDSEALPAKIAGGVTALLTMVAFASDATGIFASDEISKSEQLFWESVEKHPSEKLYRGYLEKYPDGQFKDIALTQAANYGKESPVATIEQPAPAVVETETPPVFAMVEKPVTTTTIETPTTSEKVEQLVTAPALTTPEISPAKVEQAVITPAEIPAQTKKEPLLADKLETGWQAIDRYHIKDGLVKDTQTGLTWMRCSVGQKWDGSTCQGKAQTFDQRQVKEDINISYEGYNDWRVPNIYELKTLAYCSSGQPSLWITGEHDYCQGDYDKPAIMREVFPNAPSGSGSSWSSSPVFYPNKGYKIMDNYDGSVGYDFHHAATDGIAVRLVRREKDPSTTIIGHYEVKGGVVKDTETGLIWMRCSLGQTWDGSTCQGKAVTSHTDAQVMRIADDLSYENYDDWQLPSAFALQTLVYCSNGNLKTSSMNEMAEGCGGDDYAQPTIMNDVFPQTPIKNYFTNSYFYVDFERGRFVDARADYRAVRLVRKGKWNFNTTIAEAQQTTPPASTTETPPAAAIEQAPNNQQAPDNKVQKDEELAKAQSEIDEANKRINIVWNATTKANRLAILPEQREWLKKRENDCTLKASTEEASDKTVQETIKLHCMAAMTDPRTEELKQKVASMI
jgi:uncharacterized protein YecT (DUF1311 family)